MIYVKGKKLTSGKEVLSNIALRHTYKNPRIPLRLTRKYSTNPSSEVLKKLEIRSTKNESPIQYGAGQEIIKKYIQQTKPFTLNCINRRDFSLSHKTKKHVYIAYRRNSLDLFDTSLLNIQNSTYAKKYSE